MDPQKKKKIIMWTAAGIVVVVLAVAIWLWVWPGTKTGMSGASTPGNTSSVPVAITNIVLNRSAYQIALARAAQWESDAALMKMNSLDVTGNSWDFTFVSASVKNEGFEIVVDGQSVASAQEIAISGGGTALPANIISPDQAIAAAHAVPGYQNATIVSLNLIYNANAHQWYWGVKTNDGITLSISATQ